MSPNAGAARKLDQYAARKVDHLRDIHSTLVLSPGLFSQQPGGAIGRSSARARRLAADARLPLAAPPSHAIAFALGRDHRGMVGEAIEERRRELLVAGEDLDPFGEGEIAGDGSCSRS